MKWFCVFTSAFYASVSLASAAAAPGNDTGQQPIGQKVIVLAQAETGQEDVPADPNLTTASFADWTMRCERSSDPSPKKACDVAHTINGDAGPLAQVSIAKDPESKKLLMYVLMPTNISFAAPVALKPTDTDTQKSKVPATLTFSWRHCVPSGCLASVDLDDAALAKWRQSVKAELSLKDAAGEDLALPVSMRGLAQALDALRKEAF